MTTIRPGMWTWLLQRLTAIYIVFGLAVHFYLHHFTMKPGNEAESGERFFTAAQIGERLSGSAGWAFFYFLFLFSCAYHGMFGVVKVIEDHVTNEKVVRWLNTIAWVLIIAIMIIGLVIYNSFLQTPLVVYDMKGGN
jgi:succinate dehydrogenase hydrophobic anchor subunit